MEKVSRKDSNDMYGTWFAEGATPDAMVKRIAKQIADCQKWLTNLKALKADKEAELTLERRSELKGMLQGMSIEQIQELIAE